MIRGFNDCAIEAESEVTGGQSIMNPWPIIGGVANTVCHKDEFIMVNQAQPGDKIVLTKPLGTQVATNLNQWLTEDRFKANSEKSMDLLTVEEARESYYLCIESMATINKNAATLMQTHSAHGATDITGFGIRGHAQNLVSAQKEPLDFRIDRLPVIKGMKEINEHVRDFRLLKGYSAETSGGLFVTLPKENA